MNKNLNEIKITVVGLGYVGLPLLVLIASKGFKVYGYDISQKRINDIKNSNSLSFDYDKQLLNKMINSNNVILTTSENCLSNSDVIIVCVPTMIDDNKKPIIKHLISATKTINSHLKSGHIIIYESSTYPGCTRMLSEMYDKNNLQIGVDFHLGFSPERIDPSNEKYKLFNIPKVISGYSSKCTDKIEAIYNSVFIKTHVVQSLETAEFMKLFENTFRFINISYVNEMSVLAEKLGINIWDVLEAAQTKPFGYMRFNPGPGIGGSCIPVNPWYLQYSFKKLKLESEMIITAQKVNDKMIDTIFSKIKDLTDKNIKTRILLVGIAYKKNVADSRLSPSIELIKLLEKYNYEFILYDPLIQEVRVNNKVYLIEKNLSSKTLYSSDLVVILTDHDVIDYELIASSGKSILDTRGVYSNSKKNNISVLGRGD